MSDEDDEKWHPGRYPWVHTPDKVCSVVLSCTPSSSFPSPVCFVSAQRDGSCLTFNNHHHHHHHNNTVHLSCAQERPGSSRDTFNLNMMMMMMMMMMIIIMIILYIYYALINSLSVQCWRQANKWWVPVRKEKRKSKRSKIDQNMCSH